MSKLVSIVYVMAYLCDTTSDMQGLVWGEPELAHEYVFDVKNIIVNIEVQECLLFTLFV